eukprot:CCRYP_005742-RA/>CCRYP_005742-RA protein AED:0.48 eAED:0.48 QI:0/0/0/1/0/0/3/0/75
MERQASDAYHIVDTVRKNVVTALCSDTGAWKTTQRKNDFLMSFAPNKLWKRLCLKGMGIKPRLYARSVDKWQPPP